MTVKKSETRVSDDRLLRLELLEAFHALAAALAAVSAAVRDDAPRGCWLAGAGEAPRAQAAEALADIWYRHEGDGRVTTSCLGLLGCSTETLALAVQANAAKDGFKAAALKLRGRPSTRRERLLAEVLETWHAREPGLARAMSAGGFGRVHLTQAYRHLPVLESAPARVGFSWTSRARAIVRLSVADAQRLVEALPDHHTAKAVYHARLAALPADEMLARVRYLTPNVVANLVFPSPDGEMRKAMRVHLPLLFPLESGAALPEHGEPADAPHPRGRRLLRADRRIETEAYLPGLQVYRYR